MAYEWRFRNLKFSLEDNIIILRRGPLNLANNITIRKAFEFKKSTNINFTSYFYVTFRDTFSGPNVHTCRLY